MSVGERGGAAGEGEFAEPPPKVTPEAAAEAAVWVARLHGPNRSPQMEQECLAWQARSAANRLAFERCTDTWQEITSVSVAQAFAAAAAVAEERSAAKGRGPRFGGPLRWGLSLAAVGALAVLCAVLQPWRDAGAYGTGVGEQRMVVLDDGTRMSLNTNTRVSVELGGTQRLVNVEEGEALFEVAKDTNRPFIVRAGAREVVAVGTVFAVRLTHAGARADDVLAVTLIEGKVSVRAAGGGQGAAAAPQVLLVMQPGERVRFVRAAAGNPGALVAPEVDWPSLEQVVAWKRSEAVFNNVLLPEAVAEMNRYSRTPIVLSEDEALLNQRISGLFRTGDNAGFARAMGALHGWVVHESPGRLELALPQ